VIRLMLPWAVLAQANHRLTPRKNGRGLTLTREYREAKERARLLVASQTRRDPVLIGPVEVRLRFWMPDHKRRDPDNLLKLIHDAMRDRKSTRLNSSHVKISYAVFCLKKKRPSRACASRRE